MRYKGKVYRPPSEAYSLIVQVTYGCSHNGCAFCDMYDDKHFAIRPMEEVREDFEMARRVYKKVERVFLADGDALMRKTEELSQILGLIYGLFPECQRVTCYASPTSLQIKSEEDLRLLRSQGLTMVYMGLESGCDEVLRRMNKGHTAAAIVAAGQKARRCGLALSVTAISGLGSRELMREHAIGTAEAFSAMKPEYIGLLTLMVEPGTPLEKWVREGSFTVLGPEDILRETELLLQHIDSEGSVFRMNHASNYLTLKGTLNQDRDAMLERVRKGLEGYGARLKPAEGEPRLAQAFCELIGAKHAVRTGWRLCTLQGSTRLREKCFSLLPFSYRLSGIIEVPAVVKPMATSPESKRDRNSTSNRLRRHRFRGRAAADGPVRSHHHPGRYAAGSPAGADRGRSGAADPTIPAG